MNTTEKDRQEAERLGKLRELDRKAIPACGRVTPGDTARAILRPLVSTKPKEGGMAKGLTVVLAVAATLWPQPAAGQGWVRDPFSGTVGRPATIEGLGSRYRGARAELTLGCGGGRAVNVSMVLYGGPARSMPVGFARVDNAPPTAIRPVATQTFPEDPEPITIAVVSPVNSDGGALRRALRAGLRLRVAVDFPELPEAVLFYADLRGFTAQERRACG